MSNVDSSLRKRRILTIPQVGISPLHHTGSRVGPGTIRWRVQHMCVQVFFSPGLPQPGFPRRDASRLFPEVFCSSSRDTMKLVHVGSLAVLAGSPMAEALRTIANPATQEKYTSGAVMDSMMAAKYVGGPPPPTPTITPRAHNDADNALPSRPRGTARRPPAPWTRRCILALPAPARSPAWTVSPRSSQAMPTTPSGVTM